MDVTIVCADDDRNFCQILARTLRAEGYRVETAHDGVSALERVRELGPALVTLDVMLPRRDGFAVLDALRREAGPLCSTPVVLFSGCRFTPADRARAERLGADAVLEKPVPLEQLLKTLRAHMRKKPPPARPAQKVRRHRTAPRAARATDARKEAPSPEEGSLATLPFPMLLHQLHGLRASGVLQLRHGRKKKQVQLREGRPVAVRSNLVDETLGHLLLASGKITEDVLHASLLRVKQGEGLHGQILQAMHMLDEEDLARALRHQAEEKLFEVFAWPGGSFRFVRGARLRDANALTVKGSAASLILGGVRSRTPLAVVERFLTSWGGHYPAPNESPFYRFQEVELDPRASAWLEAADGATRLADLLGPDEIERRLAFGLAVLELVVLHEAPKAPAERTGPAPQARPLPPPAPDPRSARAAAAPPEATEARQAEAGVAAAPSVHAHRDDTGALRGQEQAIREELSAMAERLRGRDAFGALGLGRDAGDEAIRLAYTDLAKRTHPDRFSASSDAVKRLAEDVFGIISHAYERIGTAQQRAAYFAGERRAEEHRAELEVAQRALRAEQAFQRGQQALRARSYQRALACFREAVEHYDEEAEYHAYCAWAWYLADPEEPGRLREAVARARQARKLAPDREKPYLILGRLYKAAGRMEAAEKMFTRAVQLDPDCVEALRELRLIHMRRQKSRGLVQRILRR